MADVTILIPAAGAARRMRGADKLTEEIGGEPALRRAARIALAATPSVLVTLPADGPFAASRRTALAGLAARPLPLTDAGEGMAAGLRAGARAAGTAAGLMVLLPDMPEIGADDIARLVSVFGEDRLRPVRATTGDGSRAGHPVILPRRLFPALLALRGDQGAKLILEGEDVRAVPLPGRRAVIDLDTPEDWAAWRQD